MKAIVRFFRTIGYLLSGKIDKTTDKIAVDASVVRAEYKEVIDRKNERVIEMRDAVAGLLSINNRKKSKLEDLVKQIEELERRKAGSIAFAKKVAENREKEEVKLDPHYLKAVAALKDYSSTLEEKESHRVDLESDIESNIRKIQVNKQQLLNAKRELGKLRQERHEAAHELAMAKSERAASEALAGISSDDTSDQLRSLRERVSNAKSRAEITSELAGVSSSVEDMEFLNMAEEAQAQEEMDGLIFGPSTLDKPQETGKETKTETESTEF